jgi:anti-sigma B factor antagonist
MVTPTKTVVEQSGELAVMRFAGDISSSSQEAVLGSYLALDPGTTKILLDFSKVSYMNSSGIALVIQLLVDAGKASRKIVCFGLSAHFVKIFKMLGLAGYPIKTDEAEARRTIATL